MVIVFDFLIQIDSLFSIDDYVLNIDVELELHEFDE